MAEQDDDLVTIFTNWKLMQSSWLHMAIHPEGCIEETLATAQ